MPNFVHPPQRGWTLLESLLVLCLITASLAASVTSLSRWWSQQQLRKNASALAQDLRSMRSSALALQTTTTLELRSAERCYVLHTGLKDDCHCLRHPSGSALPALPAPHETPWHWTSDWSGQILGQVQCTPGTQIILARAWDAPWTLTASAAAVRFDPEQHTLTPTTSWTLQSAANAQAPAAWVRHIVNITGRLRSCALPALGAWTSCAAS